MATSGFSLDMLCSRLVAWNRLHNSRMMYRAAMPFFSAEASPTNGRRYLEPTNGRRYLEPTNERRYLEPTNERRYLEPINRFSSTTIELATSLQFGILSSPSMLQVDFWTIVPRGLVNATAIRIPLDDPLASTQTSKACNRLVALGIVWIF
jgi:hypothetical protein